MRCPSPLPVEKGDAAPKRRGAEIPGYGGFVPRKCSDNIIGGTFGAANEKAACLAAGIRSGGAGAGDIPDTEARSLSPQPGFRRKGADNIFGSLTPDDGNPTAGLFLPRHHKARYFALGGKWSDRLGCDLLPGRDTASRWDGLCVRPAASPRPRRTRDAEPQQKLDTKEIPRTLSPDRQIPGYMGFAPAIESENVYGMTYRSATEHVNNKGSFDDAGSEGQMSPMPKHREKGSGVPGYTGHIPCLVPNNIHGSRYQLAADRANKSPRAGAGWGPDPDSRDNAPRANAALKVNKNDNENSAGINRLTNTVVAKGRDTTPRPWRRSATTSPSPTRSVSRGVPPGYSGHVPRRESGNVYGKTFRHSNLGAEADTALTVSDAWQGDLRNELASSPQKMDNLPSTGAEVPGYSGYVPKKGPENVYGSSFRKANERAWSPTAKAAKKQAVAQRYGIGPGESLDETRSESFRSNCSSPSNRSQRDQRSRSSSPRTAGYVPKGTANFYCASGKGLTPAKEARSPSPLQRDNRIPNYGGYIPKVSAENMYGMRHSVSVDRSSKSRAEQKEKQAMAWEDCTASDRSSMCSESMQNVSMPSPGNTIPGYSGHVHRKGPGNVIGSTFRVGNDRSVAGADPVSESVTENSRVGVTF